MINKFIRLIFFGNYFIGVLAIALNIETNIQLGIPLNSLLYYVLIFCVTTAYYTYAYSNAGISENNLRSKWYYENRNFTKHSLKILSYASVIIILYILASHFENIKTLPFKYWIAIFATMFTAILYYGLIPKSLSSYNLRNSGWIKPFAIGFVWACCASIFPLIILHVEDGTRIEEDKFITWLFIKNWMFCTVNAIMFDIKDFSGDANLQLKTFVVRLGLRKTIFFILIPLLLLGFCSLLVFAYVNNFSTIRILLNSIPFFIAAYLARCLKSRKSIFFYLIAIDGLILLKAICGITAAIADNFLK